MIDQKRKIEILGNYGALLSVIEVGLGSFLHSLYIPFAGHLLSLNQGYLLCRVAILSEDRSLTYGVSNIAAVLKSLSPAGKKLGPMLSLSMQGLLFYLGTVVGINPIGLSLGMILLSFWAFVQPLVTYYLFFGNEIINAAEFLYQKTFQYHGIKAENLLWLFIGVIVVKVFAGIILAILAWRTQGKSDYQDSFVNYAKPKGPESGDPLILALKDLLKPIFLISLVGTAVFLYFSQHQIAEIIWYLMRPLAIGFMFFYFSRTLTLDKWLLRLENGRFHAFGEGCKVALEKIRKVF
ncbi:hypothetical protein [Peredibacter starrii]|uniref:Uncharacterized protein n=1 Tax=Peredibacter starrii TaxID=28202 RepID=A0AAX4HKC8_9BACT|nr:hypothetical protein [Peredibacter starrii]WPU63678.1 hypothetical protein SOO65_13365 [Peredibacter starrii]